MAAQTGRPGVEVFKRLRPVLKIALIATSFFEDVFLTMPTTRTGPEVTGPTGPRALLRGANTVLRGIGQVALQANSVAGVVFVLAVAWSSPAQALALLWGAGLSTALATRVGVDDRAVHEGLWGFNGALAAQATLVFMPAGAATWVAATVAALGTVPITLAVQKLLARWQLPALSLPFILALWCVLLSAKLLDGAPQAAAGASVLQGSVAPLDLGLMTHTVLNSVAQVFFQSHAGTGALVLLGLFVAAPRAALLAVLGAASGSAVAWALGASAEALHSGMQGFSGALAAVAVGSVLLPTTMGRIRPLLWAMVAAGVTPLLGAALAAVLGFVGLPVLTLPFVLASWLAALRRRCG